MHWIIETDIHEGLDLPSIARSLSHDVSEVKVIPFSGGQLTPEPVLLEGDPVMILGSTVLTSIAQKRGWKPGSFYNENHDLQIWSDRLKPFLLNADQVICPISCVDFSNYDYLFIRPCSGQKEFAGKVWSKESFTTWLPYALKKGNGINLDTDFLVAVSTPKTIRREYRVFVVGGKAIDISLYKVQSPFRTRAETPTDAYRKMDFSIRHLDYSKILKYAETVANHWSPALGFCLDIAATMDDLKVVEINCLNNSGFYSCDPKRIIDAVSNAVLE